MVFVIVSATTVLCALVWYVVCYLNFQNLRTKKQNKICTAEMMMMMVMEFSLLYQCCIIMGDIFFIFIQLFYQRSNQKKNKFKIWKRETNLKLRTQKFWLIVPLAIYIRVDMSYFPINSKSQIQFQAERIEENKNEFNHHHH